LLGRACTPRKALVAAARTVFSAAACGRVVSARGVSVDAIACPFKITIRRKRCKNWTRLKTSQALGFSDGQANGAANMQPKYGISRASKALVRA
jgi:hypothetical protein